MLACYLVSKGCRGISAIAEVRNKRPGSIETLEQEDAILEYEERLIRRRDR